MKVGEVFRVDLEKEIKEVIKVDDADAHDVIEEIEQYVVTEHIRNGDLEARDSRECMNCNRKAFAVRVKPGPRLRSRTA